MSTESTISGCWPSPDRPAPASAPHVYMAISEVTKRLAVEGISKSRKNQQQGYSFRGVDDIYNALAPILSDVGLCILPRASDRTIVERESQRGGTLFYVTMRVEFDFVSAKDGSQHLVTTYGEAMDSADKATNKAMSAAYKYACIQAFCIPTEGDNDADHTTHEVSPAARARKVAERKMQEIQSGQYTPDPDPRTSQAPPTEEELRNDIRQSIASKKKKDTTTKFEMLQHFAAMKKRFKALNAEGLYYGILGAYHNGAGVKVEHSNEFLDTEAGRAEAHACFKQMMIRIQDLEAEEMQKKELIGDAKK